MMCSIYKSAKKPDTYLYIPYDSKFEDLPEGLIQVWGTPELVMHLDLAKRETLALCDIQEVTQKLEEEGYFLQMPPSEEEIAQLIAGKK